MIDRASPIDLMELASDCGPVPLHAGALLRFAPGLDLERARAAIAERLGSIPRLRQRLRRAPPGCGRPYWVDHPGFDVAEHVMTMSCRAPGDEEAVVEVAADLLTRRLPPSRPLWAAWFIIDLDNGSVALLVMFHHVLADGMGGLAMLAGMVDGATASPPLALPRLAPSVWQLLRDAWRTRLAVFGNLGAVVVGLRDALAELRPRDTPRAARCSLNAPTGPRRRFALATADLEQVRRVAHAHGGTVNDVVLTAVTGALHSLLDHRGEPVGHLVVSVPVSQRSSAAIDRLGNRVGVIPMALPGGGSPIERLETTVRITRARKGGPRGASASVLAPAFRMLASLGLFKPFVDHQRLVNTFITNLRGPGQSLSLVDTPITMVVPVSAVPGNVTVAFDVLSYAGVLTLTIVADADRCPDLDILRSRLQEQLDLLLGEPT